MIKVLIVEDSGVVREYLEFILSNAEGIEVIGKVGNGKEAIEFLKDHRPDIITMDVNMPVMDGLEATRIIMSTFPTPIIIVSASQNTKEVPVSLDALAAGALSVIEKPMGLGHPKEKESRENFIKMVRLMSEVKVVRRRTKPAQSVEKSTNIASPKVSSLMERLNDVKIVAIGVSSGGPNILKRIFSRLEVNFPCPILVVQHISQGFLLGLVAWLAESTNLPIRIAENNDILEAGKIYFAPNNYQMEVNSRGKVTLSDKKEADSICPSVSTLFASVAKEFKDAALGIILTGMGNDGAAELKKMRDAGAVTVAQDKESSLVFGMPKVAIELNAVEFVMNPEEIADFISNIIREHNIKSSTAKVKKDKSEADT